MSGISTHVLNTATGKPAAGITARLMRAGVVIGTGITGSDGRISALLPGQALQPGAYRLVFDIANYFPDGFYPEVSINFVVHDETSHYHVPLLLSPFGYTTYRGS